MSKVILWFRNDLRIKDNILFNNPAVKSAEQVCPVYIFDPRHFAKNEWHPNTNLPTNCSPRKCNNVRAQFLVESVYNLKRNLRSIGSELNVFHGLPEEILPLLCDTESMILAQTEHGPEEMAVCRSIHNRIKGRMDLLWGGTLLHIEDIPKKCSTELSTNYTTFRNTVESKFHVRSLFPTPKRLPPHDDVSTIPGYLSQPITLNALGMEPVVKDKRADIDFVGGEDAGQRRIRDFCDRGLSTYKSTRNGLSGDNYSSHFSAWLANGTVSAKQIFWAVTDWEARNGGQTVQTYWITFELLWRDYFRFLLLRHRSALFLEYGPFNRNKTSWVTNDDFFESWKMGMTGIPFIDACMRQLRVTGWMSNRGRQNVASFLIFELGLDWRLGAAYFEENLLDHDVASNYGNWLAAANLLGGRANRFNCIKQAYDYDSHGHFIKTWVPELKHVPVKHLFEPWKMNHREQTTAKCIIGKDYPRNVVPVLGWDMSKKPRKFKKNKRWHKGKRGKFYTS